MSNQLDQITDQRPPPKPRIHPELWQAYQWWYELMELRKRHDLRISSIKRGKSNMSLTFEIDMINAIGVTAGISSIFGIKVSQAANMTNLDRAVDFSKKRMILQGRAIGPVWEWLISIKGLKAGSLPAQLLAQIDDISLSPNVSSLWRFAGWAVIDGVAERNRKGEKSHFNRKLKGICWNITDQFIKQRTPIYRDIYDDEKEIQQLAHPDPLCSICSELAVKGTSRRNGKSVSVWRCPVTATHKPISFTPQHLHNRALRKMIKIFLQHLWLIWRESEGLPTNAPYVEAILGHSKIIKPERI